MVIAERRGKVAMAETALSQINAAWETMRDAGDATGAAYYGEALLRARGIVASLHAR